MKSWIFKFGKAEIGLGTAIFGISVKNYRGYRNSRPNPLLGGLFRGRLKISILDMGISTRKPCLIIQSEPLCENCPACRNSEPPLGNVRTKNKTAIFKKKYSNKSSPGGDAGGNLVHLAGGSAASQAHKSSAVRLMRRRSSNWARFASSALWGIAIPIMNKRLQCPIGASRGALGGVPPAESLSASWN